MSAPAHQQALLDAHAHFFLPGFVGALPQSCRRQSPDEITLYQAYAAQHNIGQVLAVGYEGAPWALGNNTYLAQQAAQHAWLRPLAYVISPADLTIAQLQTWQAQRFVGITFYIFNEAEAEALAAVSDEVWTWLADHAWLISVNSTGEHWTRWEAILSRHPELRLLIAHLGLPPAAPITPSTEEAQAVLEPLCALGQYPQTYIKYSGFYALAEPGYAYPHRAAWPYAQTLFHEFGPSRILWASDFSPALETVSFAQTVAVVGEMPWLSTRNLAAIYHDNLAQLLDAVQERTKQP